MSHICPRCHSIAVVPLNFARKAGGTVGTVAGAVGGFAAASAGAETGAVAGAAFGPVGVVVGGLAGAVVGSLVGGFAGGTAGITLGHVIDENVLDNFRCTHCEFVFGKRHDMAAPAVPPAMPDEDEELAPPFMPDPVTAPDQHRGLGAWLARVFGRRRPS